MLQVRTSDILEYILKEMVENRHSLVKKENTFLKAFRDHKCDRHTLYLMITL